MLNSKKAESVAGIIIGIFILSFVLLGIGNLVGNSNNKISSFNKRMDIDILEKNTNSIIEELDLSTLNNGDKFYIYKNNNTKLFEIKNTPDFQYIDKNGNKIEDISNYNKNIYTRVSTIQKINIKGVEKTFVKNSISLFNK